ncbi:MAG: hypothetical protein WAV51_04860 [Microgenomates group bacterium]
MYPFRLLKTAIANGFLHAVIRLTPPVYAKKYSKTTGIVTKIGHKYITMYVLMMKTFVFFSKLSLATCVIDDGTLTKHDRRVLAKHVRNIRIINASAGLRAIKKIKTKYPNTYRYRMETHPDLFTHNTCVYDLTQLSGFKKFIILDADIIFFKKPTAIINWVHSKKELTYYMAFPSCYLYATSGWGRIILQIFATLWKSDIPVLFNDGIICGYKHWFTLDLLERHTKTIYSYGLQHSWISLILIWSGIFVTFSKNPKKPVKPLPAEHYGILTVKTLQSRLKNAVFSYTCLHYIGPFKHLYLPFDAYKLFKSVLRA